MSGNTFGNLFAVTNFGESHGPAIGCVIDGCPPGMPLCEADIQGDLDRRRPGTSRHVTQRNEPDAVEILSGVYEGKTTGTPICLLIKNTDQRSKDYGNILDTFRPGHADYTYLHKYGLRDPRGGGRSSARLTAPMVAAGAVAKKWLLAQYGTTFRGCMAQIGEAVIPFESWEHVVHNPFFAPVADVANLENYMDALRKAGDSCGARIRVVASNVPVGLGEPLFDKLDADIAFAMVNSLIPDNIARQVLGYLTQFSGQASKLGGAGLAVLLLTAVALILTIDRTLNSIWRVRQPRPLAQRVLICWAAITLGPLVLAASLAVTSYVVSASSGLVGELPFSLRFVLDLGQLLLMAGGMAALYRYVPNTHVKWSHAWVGGLLVACSLEIGKKVLGLYLTAVPSYSLVYGAFAALPILLVWIYVSWTIVLMGAVVTANLPSLLAGAPRRGSAHGWYFQLAIEVLQHLSQARGAERLGLGAAQLGELLEIDGLQLEQVLATLTELGWIGELAKAPGNAESRYLLLVNPDTTLLGPLMQQLLLDRAPSVQNLWVNASWCRLSLSDAL